MPVSHEQDYVESPAPVPVARRPPGRGRLRLWPWSLAVLSTGASIGAGVVLYWTKADVGPEVYALLRIIEDKKGKVFDHPDAVRDFDEFRRT